MTTFTTTFQVPDWIANGLLSGAYERMGGVIREVDSKKIVSWLREAGNLVAPVVGNPALLPFDPVSGAINIALTAGNTLLSQGNVEKNLKQISKDLLETRQGLQDVKGVMHLTSAVSLLNLGISVTTFALITQRLNDLEQRIKQTEEILKKLERKIDLGFYANFRAALDLATNAFTMSKAESRKSMAIQAINRFLEAQHIYTDFVTQELRQGSQITDEYLLTLALAYIAESRCYLEMEEPDTALRRLEEGAVVIRNFITQYLELLLTSNPAVYLHPQYNEVISLSRLTKIYQWINPELNEGRLFEILRDKIFNWAKDQSDNKWVTSLPPAIVAKVEVQGGWFGNTEEMKREAMKRLPEIINVMESMIETEQRFESYGIEIKALITLNMTFHDWLKLNPTQEELSAENNLMLIIPSEPI